jgi:diguanylate cyclase (GGDEF)-like protein
MADVSRARPIGSFATRLAVAVLLAAFLGSALVTLFAQRLATGAVQRETIIRVVAAAEGAGSQLSRTVAQQEAGRGIEQEAGRSAGAATAAVPETAPGAVQEGLPSGTGPEEAVLARSLTTAVAAVAAEPDVLELLVVDERGTDLVRQPGSTHPSAHDPATSPAIRATLSEVARTRRTLTDHGPGTARLTVSVPLRLPDRAAALRVVLDAAPAEARADQLWRALGVALMLGAGSTAGLVFLTGGWALARRHERALVAADTDDLTGLGSSRAFRRDLRVNVEHATRYLMPLTLALIDVNGLETVNGTVGRRRGDALLLGVGSVLRRATGPAGRPVPAYRIGGDAFALIMPGAGQDNAFTLTDVLRRQISWDAAPLTADVGLSVLDTLRCPDPETLLIAADAALFEARSLGGNRVVGAGDGGTGLRWVATSGAHDRLAP